MGMRVALWSIDSYDASGYPASAIIDTVARKARPGAIVLFHDGGAPRDATIEACTRLVPMLQGEGYELVTVSELMRPAVPSTAAVLPPGDGDLARR